MLRTYLKLAFRNLRKNRGSSFINLFGLSVAIGCCIVVAIFLERTFSADYFHADGERIFMVQNIIDRDGTRQHWGDAPTPLGPVMVAELPQVEEAVRVEWGNAAVRSGGDAFDEGFWYVDPNFLTFFTFPLAYGDPEALHDPGAVILSDDTARKYFGEENALGRELSFKFGNDEEIVFTVRGVAAPFSDYASFRFRMLVPYERQVDAGVVTRTDDWKEYTAATFLRLRAAGDLGAVAGAMDRYLALQNAASEDWPIAAFAFDNLYHLSRNAQQVRGSLAGGPPPAALVVLSLLGLFLLALACFNYINIAMATATRRMKEIGVRKVMGSSRRQLIVQFLVENLLLCLLALGVGIALAHFLLFPGFNAVVGSPDVYGLDFTHPTIWALLLLLLALTGLASGAYPAFYIASFEALDIFRGRQRLERRRFTQAFLGFQFTLAFLTMIAGVVIVQNAYYQEARDWGYDEEQVVVVPLKDDGQYTVLADRVRGLPDVVALSGGRHHLGRGRGYSVTDVYGTKVEAGRYDVDPAYLETMGLRLQQGRFFDPDRPADPETAVVVNETFVRNVGWEAPLGQRIRIDTLHYEVVGVTADFHDQSFFNPIQPTVFRARTDDQTFRYLTVRTQPGAAAQTEALLASYWRELYPDLPYEGFFQNAAFDNFYQENRDITRLFTFTALMALLIASMGLFGLASQNIARRMKEISIRKVLGASVPHITTLVNRSFVLLLVLAAVVATPLGFYGMEALLDNIYEYRTPINALPFVISYAIIFATAFITIATQIRRIVTANPAEVLRNE